MSSVEQDLAIMIIRPSAFNVNLHAALELVEADVFVFACNPDKTPIGNWKAVATKDPNHVRSMWAAHPEALIGIPVGRIGLVVIDADAATPTRPVAGRDWLNEQLPERPFGPVTLTPGGGRHYYFRPPPGERLGNGRGSIPASVALDVRGAGGYVVGAGSVMPDGRCYEHGDPHYRLAASYAATRENERYTGAIPELPERLAAILRSPPQQKDSTGVRPSASRVGLRPLRDGGGGREANSRERGIGEHRLKVACERLAAMTVGSGRYTALRNAALNIGGMVAVGWVDRTFAEQCLFRAMQANGYGQSKKVTDQIKSSLDYGASNPPASIKMTRGIG